MEDQSQAPISSVRQPIAPSASNTSSPAPTRTATAASTPSHSRVPTANNSMTTGSTAATPVHPAASLEDAGGIFPPQRTSSPSPIPIRASPPTSAAVGTLTGGSTTENEDYSALMNENASLKDQLTERDHLIRKLELQVEQFRVNARKAREALVE